MNSRSKLRFRMEIGGVCAQISRLTRTCANRVASVAEEEKAKQENLPVNLAESQLSENLGQDIENLEAILESLDNSKFPHAENSLENNQFQACFLYIKSLKKYNYLIIIYGVNSRFVILFNQDKKP